MKFSPNFFTSDIEFFLVNAFIGKVGKDFFSVEHCYFEFTISGSFQPPGPAYLRTKFP